MKLFLAITLALLAALSLGAEGTVALSGNVEAGLKADIAPAGSSIYAWTDNNGAPVWINTRIDYSLDGNAGLTINFRTKGTDTVSSGSARFYPFLNRGFVWAKFAEGLVKVRSGYLWDLDFESSFNGWDTANTYEWTSEVTVYPMEGLELGAIIPTPYDKMPLEDALKNMTYGVAWTPSFGRVSAMFELGATDAQRSANFGVDFTAIPGLTLRVEGDLQQVGIEKAGYYQLFGQASLALGALTPDVQVTGTISKTGGPTAIKVYPNVSLKAGEYTLFAGLAYSAADAADIGKAAKVLELNARKALNKKAWMQGGAYFAMPAAGGDMTTSPYVNFVASF